MMGERKKRMETVYDPMPKLIITSVYAFPSGTLLFVRCLDVDCGLHSAARSVFHDGLKAGCILFSSTMQCVSSAQMRLAPALRQQTAVSTTR
jgi:hypothetical protein